MESKVSNCPTPLRQYLPGLIALLLTACSSGNSTGDSAGAPPAAPQGPVADATLGAFTLSGGKLDQIFQPNQTSYSANVGYFDNAVRISAAPSDPAAIIKVNGQAISSQAPHAIALQEGQNGIDITVENGSARRSYSVAVTRAPRTSLRQVAYLKASNSGMDDVFGTGLSLLGNTLVVTAPYEDGSARGVNGNGASDSAPDSGAAYVFTKDSAGIWSQQAYLKASNTDALDYFGYSMALSADMLAVGAPQESSAATGVNGDQSDNTMFTSGAVYIFVRDSSGIWTQDAYLKASNPAPGDNFGSAVAISGDTLAVTSRGGSTLMGKTYVFTRDTHGSWTQQAVLSPSDATPDFGFGQALALDGDTLAVGSPMHGGLFSSSGAAYIFHRESGVWSEVTRLKGSNTESRDRFGSSVALADGTLVIGAPGEASRAPSAGGNERDNAAPGSGAVYVFERQSTGAWNQKAYIKASNAEADDTFGYAVALSGDWLAVTADNEGGSGRELSGTASMENNRPGSGAAYLFVRNPTGQWSEELYVKAGNADNNDRFGRNAAALSRTNLIFAAPFEDSAAQGVNGNATSNSASSSGAVYIFE